VQNLTWYVLVALSGALVVIGGYHALIVAPQLRRLTAALEAHDSLLGGGGAKATDRIAALESAAAAAVGALASADRRIGALETVATNETPRVGFVRYNAFADTGSDLSYALAFLNKKGDGVVVSSIWSREETRTYGKAVKNFTPAQDASSEELAAIAQARAATS
jgi:hypothetical protein